MMKTYGRKSTEKSSILSEPLARENFLDEPLTANTLSSSTIPRRRKITDYFYKRLSVNDNDDMPRQTDGTSPRTDDTLHRTDDTSHRTGDTSHRTGDTSHRTGDTSHRTGDTLPRSSSSKKTKLQQTFLDLGQKGLFMATCEECGLCYDRSFEQDVKRHDVEHRRLYQCFEACRYQRYIRWRETLASGDSIWMIPGSAIPKIGMVLIGRVNSQMGAVAQQSKDLEQMNLIIYISNLKIVGVLLVESVTEGVKYHNDVAIEECKVVVGVSRIWTDPVYRRNGIAKRLLLAIKRCNHQSAAQCSDSCRIPPNRVAFSQPTSDGKMLAKWYLNDQTTDFIYYTDT